MMREGEQRENISENVSGRRRKMGEKGIHKVDAKPAQKEEGDYRKAVCISSSNMVSSKNCSTSIKICEILTKKLSEKNIANTIVDLRRYEIMPCVGCGGCFKSRRCCSDPQFNWIYDEIAQADYLFIVSPHYAPIPAKLNILLEKMEQITFLHWWKDNTYESELYRIPTGIISHGGGSDWALLSYKAMVNDTIANALDTIQLKTIPYNNEWNTGISLPIKRVTESESIFPVQEYDWNVLEVKICEYADIVLQEV